jgi:hypothetical protein
MQSAALHILLLLPVLSFQSGRRKNISSHEKPVREEQKWTKRFPLCARPRRATTDSLVVADPVAARTMDFVAQLELLGLL